MPPLPADGKILRTIHMAEVRVLTRANPQKLQVGGIFAVEYVMVPVVITYPATERRLFAMHTRGAIIVGAGRGEGNQTMIRPGRVGLGDAAVRRFAVGILAAFLPKSEQRNAGSRITTSTLSASTDFAIRVGRLLCLVAGNWAIVDAHEAGEELVVAHAWRRALVEETGGSAAVFLRRARGTANAICSDMLAHPTDAFVILGTSLQQRLLRSAHTARLAHGSGTKVAFAFIVVAALLSQPLFAGVIARASANHE
jgi:hypothetical protein